MTVMTETQTIRNFITEEREACPWFYVVGSEFATTDSTLRACEICGLENCTSPRLVSISTMRNIPGASIPFVSWMIFSALKVRSVFPCWQRGSAFDAPHSPLSLFWIAPLLNGTFSCLLLFCITGIRTGIRTILSICTWRSSEILAAIATAIKYWWMLTFTRAVFAAPICRPTWRCFKLRPATLTNYFDSAASVSCPAFIATFKRAILPASVFQFMGSNMKNLSAIFAGGIN